MALAVGLLAGDDDDAAVRFDRAGAPSSSPRWSTRACPGPWGPAPAPGRTPSRCRGSGPRPGPRACRARKPSQPIDVDGLLDALLGGDAVERLAGEHGQRRLVAHDVVAATDLDPVDAELGGDDVEQPLAQEVRGGPRPPVGDVGGLVGEDRASTVDVEGLDPRRPLEHRA